MYENVSVIFNNSPCFFHRNLDQCCVGSLKRKPVNANPSYFFVIKSDLKKLYLSKRHQRWGTMDTEIQDPPGLGGAIKAFPFLSL